MKIGCFITPKTSLVTIVLILGKGFFLHQQNLILWVDYLRTLDVVGSHQIVDQMIVVLTGTHGSPHCTRDLLKTFVQQIH